MNSIFILLGSLVVILIGALVWLWSSGLAAVVILAIGVALLLLYMFARRSPATGEQTTIGGI